MRLVLPVVLAVIAAGTVVAQTASGEISGVVRDMQGGVLPGVTIVAEHLESGTRIERVSELR
jgi:hypothetical protein